MASKNKYYVVWEGNQPGIYDSWTACQLQIKGYPNAKYKAFKTREEAEQAYRGGYTFTPKAESKSASKKPIGIPSSARKDIVWDSIAVDAACSGNPGLMEYQGVDTKTGMQIFHKKFSLGTNNIGEFLAIVHALAMFKQQGKATPIYTDSKIAMGWVARKKAKTTLKHSPKTALLHNLIERAETWLKNNTYPNKIMKWKTEEWGEIPADFGRK
ncbi:MAG: ribonuclease H family protein [Saprospiraceae bacterium]